MTGIPPVVEAIVVSQDPDNYAVNVMVLGIGGGQMTSLPVKVLTHGPRDALRGDFPELPHPGQTGLVVFTRGDIRNGRWIGSTEPALNDANPYTPGVTGLHYRARYSGAWDWHGPDGTTAAVLADGTSFLAGSALPSPTRHTVDGSQVRQATSFTQAQRVPSPPSPMPLTLRHASGTVLTMNADGSVSVAIAGTTVTVDVSGNATVTTTVFKIVGELQVTGEVTAGYGTGDSVTLRLHRHDHVQLGGSLSDPPKPGT